MIITFGFTNTALAEPIDVSIDWVIEGQMPIEKLVSDTSIESPIENESLVKEQINNLLISNNETSNDTVEDFITGSNYMIAGSVITIDSKEGQLLNQLLIEQRETNRENFFHMIKYLDRYSDGYVELAEALIDPVRQQNYQQNGIVRDYNINSNLEYFLVERGYDLDDLESIPNNAFSPTKYDAVRVAAAQAANTGEGSTDLRELLPNYVKHDSKVIKDEMIRKLTEQTTDVYDSISSSKLEISISQSPQLTDSITSNLFNDFQFVNTKFDNSKFENTQHVIDILDGPQNILEIDPSSDYSTFILIGIFTILILIFFVYILFRKSRVEVSMPLLTVNHSINYIENTNNMIKSSRDLFENNLPKYAFEKFSQAIRYYYSNKLKINLDLTATEIMFELEKSNIDNFEDVKKWLLLCSQVEFVKHESNQKEFLNALDSFSNYVS